MQGIFGIGEKPLTSHEGLFSVPLVGIPFTSHNCVFV